MSSHTLKLMDSEAPKSQIAMLKVSAKNVVHQDRIPARASEWW